MKKNVGISYKAFAVILAAVLILGGAIGGTMAWLIDDTEAVANVFTDSDIEITLNENKGTLNDSNEHEFKMVPGHTVEKDPRVTVKAGSEDCWLFVEVKESTDPELSKYIKYSVNTTPSVSNDDGVNHGGWKQGTETDGIPTNVYYQKVTNVTADQEFAVLGGGTHSFEDYIYTWNSDEVLTLPEVTKAEMNAIKDKNKPTLTFTAYAVQLYKTNKIEFTANQAWARAQGIANNSN